MSDFEVSESEHSEVEIQNNAPTALASVNVDGKTGLVGHEIDDVSDQNVDEMKAKKTGVMGESMDEGEYSFPNDALAGNEETGIEDKVQEKDIARNKTIATNNLLKEIMKEQNEVKGVVAPSRNETENLLEDEVPTETGKDVHEQNVDSFSRENDMTHSGDVSSIQEKLQNTDGDVSTGKSKVIEEDQRVEETNVANNSRKESEESVIAVLESEEKGENNDKESNGKFLSEDEKSKSGVLEELSLSSVESSSESLPVKVDNTSKKKVAGSMSYTEDFEEKSVSLTQSAAYQKMLSAVHVSDEEGDLEEEFLEGTMSEANTTAQSTHNPEQTLPDARKSQAKLPVKSSRPTLTLFSSGERDDFGSSFGKEGAGLSASWQSSEGTLSPPLSPDTGGYIPSVAVAEKTGNKQEEKDRESVSPVGETNDKNVEKEKIQPKPQDSNTKSRIQAGFWNHSDSESEIDLQVSHGGQNNDADDDDDFDFYS